MKKSIQIHAAILSETERALKAAVTWQHLETLGRFHEYYCWLPKSQTTVLDSEREGLGAIRIEIPTWLADRIGNEIRERFGMCAHLGGKGIIYDFN